MRAVLDPFSFLVVSIAGWMNQGQHQVIDYLVEENRVLREQIGNRRMRFTDSQRFLYGFVDTEGANWRHRQLSKWAVDGSDCTLSNGCRGWFLRWKTIFGHRNRPAPVDGRNGRDVQLQPLNVVVERGRIRWNGRRQRSVRRPGTVAVRLHQDSLRRKIDHQQLISVGVALAGQSRFV